MHKPSAQVAQGTQEPFGKTALRRKAVEMHSLQMKSLRDTNDILEAENKVLPSSFISSKSHRYLKLSCQILLSST